MNYFQGMAGQWTPPFGGHWLAGVGLFGFLVLLVWSVYWKGRALWKSAREGKKEWFVALLIINTAGILEILYLYVFSRKKAYTRETSESVV